MSERFQVLAHSIPKPRPSAGVAGSPLRSRRDAWEAVARLADCGWGGFIIERVTRGDAERWLVAAEPPASAEIAYFSLMPFAGRLRAPQS